MLRESDWSHWGPSEAVPQCFPPPLAATAATVVSANEIQMFQEIDTREEEPTESFHPF